MNPIYKFEIATEYNGVTHNYPVYPLRKSDLAKEYSLEQNEMFYRAKLDGKLTFVKSDYAIIANARFETEFTLTIFISYDNGQSWSEYWKGVFYKTDCDIDEDAQTVVVTPSPVDEYTKVLEGRDKEYDLIKLHPEIEHLILAKRPLIQVYVPGDSVVSCFLSGMSWEQDCEPESNETTLVNTYHFGLNTKRRIIDIVESSDPNLPRSFNGPEPSTDSTPFSFTRDGYTMVMRLITGGFEYAIEQGGTVMWRNRVLYSAPPTTPFEMTLGPVNGTGNVKIFSHNIHVFARYLCDVDNILGEPTAKLPLTDLVENNRNYHRVTRYLVENIIYFSTNKSTEPTEWGIQRPGVYYMPPALYWDPALYPVSRSNWGETSIWFAFSATDQQLEEAARKEYVLKDSYPLSSAIKVLLSEIAPGVTHEPTTEYSRFLYGSINPISGDAFRLYITQKSNILAGDYTQPAQKAPITLKTITDMLRDCFRAYWYIEDGKFKIEHVEWFRNGGSYTGNPVVSHDLTAEIVTRNNKPWSFGTSKFEYEKEKIPSRFQFGWMDDVTQAFEGYPIDVLSRFVSLDNTSEVRVNEISTDVDYMLLNPGAFSQDGFALLGAVDRNMITPDAQYVHIPFEPDYPVRYAFNSSEGSNITIQFNARATDVTGYIRVAFLKSDGTPLGVLGEFGSPGDHKLSGSAPAGTAYIGFEQITRIGDTDIKVSGIFGEKSLPFISARVNGIKYLNQNGYLAFINLQPKYYVYDMPSYQVKINGSLIEANGITKHKKQSVKIPLLHDPNPIQLIRTQLGDGQIEKMSIDMSSRVADVTLMFDTYNYSER